MGERYRTGETSMATAYYEWDGYIDGTRTPQPTAEEKKIKLEKYETFPPINSCDKGAYWKMTSYA
ncbi:YjzC family protein [Lentibacillus cibarius]|uniref:YjzC family protein n=1 Tax=Lentibacillus cibarius TaxID=2583219 RepID=A0A5S3QPS2_9BACI|nr:YjzC family protein [Lentibacillus cibarius]